MTRTAGHGLFARAATNGGMQQLACAFHSSIRPVNPWSVSYEDWSTHSPGAEVAA